MLLGVRFIYLTYYIATPDLHRTYLASLILLSIFATFGMILLLLALFGELSKGQRKLLENIIINQRKMLLSNSQEDISKDIIQAVEKLTDGYVGERRKFQVYKP